MDSIQANGYLVFVVDGPFVCYDPEIFADQLNEFKRFYSKEEILENHEKEKKNPNYKLNSGGTDQGEMDKILEQSLKEYQEKQKSNNLVNKTENDKEKYFKGEQINFSEKKNSKCKIKSYSRK